MKFTKSEQNAIEEKLSQLKKIGQEKLSQQELAELITERRLKWLKNNLAELRKKYKNLKPEEQAYRIIFFEHMKINPEHSKMSRISHKKIMIESHNFCPYLEACRILDLDTRCICKDVGERSIQRMCEKIHPGLKFSRNYKNIRPQNKNYCEEYIEII